MKTSLLLLLAALCVFTTTAQIVFEKSYGTPQLDEALCVHQTADGGYILGGNSTDTSGDFNFYLVKTDALGNLEWERTFGTPFYNETARAVLQTADGGYLFAGDRFVMGQLEDSRLLLLKTDAAGNPQSFRTYDGVTVSGMILTADSSLVLSGVLEYSGAGPTALLFKLSLEGDSLWKKSYSGFSLARIRQTGDGGFIATGFNGDICLMKTDNNGDSTWMKIFSVTGGEDHGTDVHQIAGGYILLGNTISTTMQSDMHLIQTDASGSRQWTQTFPGFIGRTMQLAAGGGYAVAGGAWFTEPAAMIKTNNAGDSLWQKTFSAHSHSVMGMQQTADGGYVLCSSVDNNPGGSMANLDVYAVKTNGNGELVSSAGQSLPAQADVTITPNPVKDIATITISNYKVKAQSLTVAVFDAQGKQVEAPAQINAEKKSVEIKLTTARLPAGTYFYQVLHGSAIANSGRMVVQ